MNLVDGVEDDAVDDKGGKEGGATMYFCCCFQSAKRMNDKENQPGNEDDNLTQAERLQKKRKLRARARQLWDKVRAW